MEIELQETCLEDLPRSDLIKIIEDLNKKINNTSLQGESKPVPMPELGRNTVKLESNNNPIPC